MLQISVPATCYPRTTPQSLRFVSLSSSLPFGLSLSRCCSRCLVVVRKTVYMSSAVCRKDDWKCSCGYVNFQKRRICSMCKNGKAEGVLMTSTNMTSGRKVKNMMCGRRRRTNRKSGKLETATTNVYTALRPDTLPNILREWSRLHPYGMTTEVDVDKEWRFNLIHTAETCVGAHIHTSTSLWKYFKINLGTAMMKHMEWLTVPEVTLCKLNVAAEQCLSKALSVVANYDNCTRCRSERGVVWNLPCGEAFEICSIIHQPNGSLQQRVHKDGFTRFSLPGAEDVLYHNFFLNVIMPLRGDIPTLFRGPDQKMHASPMCGENEIRIFNGGIWHAGAGNDSGTGVWKLFLGLVSIKNPTAGDFPLLAASAGKSSCEEMDRSFLLADNR